ncbi:MAG: pyridoxal phosphate-dependent aminotransferase [Pseudomonadota bacterium]
MSVTRLKHITPIGVEQMGDLADSLADPDVLRLENLDTNIAPPGAALAVTHAAIADDDANSYLPFLGLNGLREAATAHVSRQSGQRYDWRTESVICAGGLSGILNVLLATLEPGDEVLLTDPTYVGLINRVRLAGGVPRFVRLQPDSSGWHLDSDALAAVDPRPIRLALLMSPSMPTGAVFDDSEWQSLIEFCQRADCWLLNDAAMERILFDEREVIHPASFEGMRERVITVGAASKEFRMIGWRVGWTVGPAEVMADIARVSISNVVCQTGIAMQAVETALRNDDDGVRASAAELQRRRDVILDALDGYDVIPPHGGWSMLMDVSPLGFDGPAASKRLLEVGGIAATPMQNWGADHCRRYVRLVYSNESVKRLSTIADRVDRALR